MRSSGRSTRRRERVLTLPKYPSSRTSFETRPQLLARDGAGWMKRKIIRCTELTRGTTQWPPQPSPLSILPYLSLRVLAGQTGVPEKHNNTLKRAPHSLIVELEVDLDFFEAAEPTRSLGEGRAEDFWTLSPNSFSAAPVGGQLWSPNPFNRTCKAEISDCA